MQYLLIRFITFSFLGSLTACSSMLSPHYETPPTTVCSQIQTCFTPGENCTGLITQTIAQAKRLILVQAYGFTSDPIVQALITARQRGVIVKVILDKSNYHPDKKGVINLLLANHISVWIDSKPRIAHNKVIALDGTCIITGSFNFTHSAQFYNAENLIVIRDLKITKRFTKNWNLRRQQSKKLPLSQA